jgi:hypothetical protein
MFRHDVQLSDRQDFPWSNRNLDRKNVLQRAKNTPATSVCGIVSLKPKLDFPQVHSFKKEGSRSFPTTPRTSKTNVRSYVNRAVDTGGKYQLLLHSKERVFSFFLDPDPHLASVCDLSISFSFRDMSCVCVCVCVCVREHMCACEHKFGVATNHGKFKV